jgi:outer membrane lipoprotein SlyB
MRQVQVARRPSGFGALAGAAAGGLGGSFIGGDWRSNALAGLGGALAGGLAGNALEGGTGGGIATEFIVREDGRGDIAITQTNEEALQVGERVYITRSDRVRLARAAGSAVPAPAGGPSYGTTPMAAPQGGIGSAK